MTDLTLTDDDRKLLTKFMGEEYHDVAISFHDGKVSKCSCGARGYIARFECKKNNRTFTTYEDALLLAKKLAEKGDWEEFVEFAWRYDSEKDPYINKYPKKLYDCYCMAWLFIDDPRRIPWLVANFLKGEGK